MIISCLAYMSGRKKFVLILDTYRKLQPPTSLKGDLIRGVSKGLGGRIPGLQSNQITSVEDVRPMLLLYRLGGLLVRRLSGSNLCKTSEHTDQGVQNPKPYFMR